jgi:hypothetical protein
METSDDLCGGLKRSLKIIGGGLEDFWWRFGGVLVDLLWLPCLVIVLRPHKEPDYGLASRIELRTSRA